MKSYRHFTFIILVLSISFNSCKKGDGDPAISLKSRKARISERWTMTRGKVGLTSYASGQSPFNSNFEFTGNAGTLTQTGTLIAYTLKYTLNLEFDKKGNFKITEDFDGLSMTSEGKWNFSSGVGKTKNKEDIFIQLETISAGDTQDHLFNHFGTEISYTVKELSKNQLVIFANSKYYMNLAGDKGVIESEYTFTKQ